MNVLHGKEANDDGHWSAAVFGVCNGCNQRAQLYEVEVPLDTDPNVYDRLYVEKFCFACAWREAKTHGGEIR